MECFKVQKNVWPMDIRKSDDVTKESLSSQLKEKKISSEAKKEFV